MSWNPTLPPLQRKAVIAVLDFSPPGSPGGLKAFPDLSRWAEPWASCPGNCPLLARADALGRPGTQSPPQRCLPARVVRITSAAGVHDCATCGDPGPVRCSRGQPGRRTTEHHFHDQHQPRRVDPARRHGRPGQLQYGHASPRVAIAVGAPSVTLASGPGLQARSPATPDMALQARAPAAPSEPRSAQPSTLPPWERRWASGPSSAARLAVRLGARQPHDGRGRPTQRTATPTQPPTGRNQRLRKGHRGPRTHSRPEVGGGSHERRRKRARPPQVPARRLGHTPASGRDRTPRPGTDHAGGGSPVAEGTRRGGVDGSGPTVIAACPQGRPPVVRGQEQAHLSDAGRRGKGRCRRGPPPRRSRPDRRTVRGGLAVRALGPARHSPRRH